VRSQVTTINDYEECFYMGFAALWSVRYEDESNENLKYVLSRNLLNTKGIK